MDRVAQQMGFGEADLDALVASFSGGWKMRIGLAKVLLERPDVLLLDEPTNHLDLESVEWLEAFLREQTLAMVIVSHDREFLDQVCTRIVDTDRGVCTSLDAETEVSTSTSPRVTGRLQRQSLRVRPQCVVRGQTTSR